MEKVTEIKIMNAQSTFNGPLEITAYCNGEDFKKAIFCNQFKNPRIIWEEDEDWEKKLLKNEKKDLKKQISEAQKKINEINKRIKELK